MKFFKKDNKRINAESINSMTISADFIGINTEYGHFEIANQVGVTKELELEKYIIKIVGGIIVDVKERNDKNG